MKIFFFNVFLAVKMMSVFFLRPNYSKWAIQQLYILVLDQFLWNYENEGSLRNSQLDVFQTPFLLFITSYNDHFRPFLPLRSKFGILPTSHPLSPPVPPSMTNSYIISVFEESQNQIRRLPYLLTTLQRRSQKGAKRLIPPFKYQWIVVFNCCFQTKNLTLRRISSLEFREQNAMNSIV